MKPAPKPPLGIQPRYIHECHRIDEIHKAINRFICADHPIPLEWIAEYNELVSRNKE
ncbi:hypothetical protein [Paenibacillus sp. ACRRY]|uniref:hypothetical protein n=1 Tax=Paenibacillus sp. ACRRY TaxID=2918208 RepID=UPI001EF57874|nr:hypothetical protein [Paenibacillus sp. ACRRY]MCG7383368.1 hypothetical protein [Paenibacillus sp. ACRRY]